VNRVQQNRFISGISLAAKDIPSAQGLSEELFFLIQEAKLGLSVMVTFTVPPSILYLQLTPTTRETLDAASP